MSDRYKQFSQKYEYVIFSISLMDSADDNILNGNINFTEDVFREGEELVRNLVDISFLISNSYDMEDIHLLADRISGDLEYVAGAYCRYCDSVSAVGSVAIIEDMVLHENADNSNEEIQLIKYFLARAMEQLQIIGVGTVLFMTKALIPNINKSERIYFIDGLLRMNFLPIYQDYFDVVMARSLDYRIEG